MNELPGKTGLTFGLLLLLTTSRPACFADEDVNDSPSVVERRARTAVIVHRGSLDLAIENTLASIEASFLTGADGVEIDIAQTSDGILVLMHDPWVDRVLTGFGNVAALTYDELLAMRYRDPYGLTRANEYVPTLRAALELIKRYDGLIHLDIKVPDIDGRVHALLGEMDLLANVVTVNAYNSQRVRADRRIQVLPSQGSLIHGNNDYDAEAVRELLARRPTGTLLVDDARCAAALLGRPSLLGSVDDITLTPLPRATKTSSAEDEPSDPAPFLKQLDEFRPVQDFALDEDRRREDAVAIGRRAALVRALGCIGNADAHVARKLEAIIEQRSLHLDGAWQGLDGSEAIRALASLRPDARTVTLLNQVAQRRDDRLTAIEKREELPTWLRQSGAWWDFRIKTEAIAALGRIGGSQSRQVLWQMLAQPADEAVPKWRELHWDAARALTAGTSQLMPQELQSLLTHETNGVRRAGCVYLVRHHDRQEYRDLLLDHLPWWEQSYANNK